MMDGASEVGEAERMRADAQRNRRRVLQAAIHAFASEGLSVPVQEIARRAGVGTGTVSRHFPTKEALYEAIVLERAGRLVEEARVHMRTREPGEAFFGYIAATVDEGAVNRGLADALSGAGFDMAAAAQRGGYDIGAVERELLDRAQAAGAVRGDVDTADVKALITACLTRERGAAAPPPRRRMLDIIRAGLRPPE
jgi:AcrR family transcriptional regulator